MNLKHAGLIAALCGVPLVAAGDEWNNLEQDATHTYQQGKQETEHLRQRGAAVEHRGRKLQQQGQQLEQKAQQLKQRGQQLEQEGKDAKRLHDLTNGDLPSLK